MQFDDIGDAILAWMEIVRAWLLEQSWLSFLHPWISTMAGSTLWAILVVSLAVIILLIGFWPSGKPKESRKA